MDMEYEVIQGTNAVRRGLTCAVPLPSPSTAFVDVYCDDEGRFLVPRGEHTAAVIAWLQGCDFIEQRQEPILPSPDIQGTPEVEP